jgi:hypothetical protein
MCEGYSEGAFHWQITREGVLKLGVKGQGETATDYNSPVVVRRIVSDAGCIWP